MKSRSTSVRQTPSGFAALWIAIGMLIFGGVVLSAPLLLVGLVVLGTWLLCRFLASRNLEGLRIRRPLPARAWVNRSFAVEAVLTTSPKSRQQPREFRFHDPIAVSKQEKTSLLPGRRERSVSYAARCSRRGRITTGKWSAVSDWPLGWFETRITGSFSTRDNESLTVLVLPDPFLPPGLQDHLEGILTAQALWTGLPDPASEFRLLREFRNGDPVRQIHWPASLRSGDILVREPDPPRPLPSRFGIFLHSFSPGGELVTPESFEMVLRIVAGLLYRFREAGIEILFQRFPEQPVTLRHREDFDRELDALAMAIRSPFSSLSKIDGSMEIFQDCDEVFVLSDADRKHWEPFLAPHPGGCHCIDSKSLSLGNKPILASAKQLQERRLAS